MKIIKKLVSNYGSRNGQVIKGIILHVGEGNRNQIYSTFLNEEKSSHYLVNMDGSVWQFVDEKNSAWHAGLKRNPVSHLVASNPGVSVNEITIGIETEGYASIEPTEELKKSLAELIEDICSRNFIEITNLNIEPHSSVRSDKSCPGLLNSPRMVRMAQKIREDNNKPLTPEQESYFMAIINYLRQQIEALIKRSQK